MTTRSVEALQFAWNDWTDNFATDYMLAMVRTRGCVVVVIVVVVVVVVAAVVFVVIRIIGGVVGRMLRVHACTHNLCVGDVVPHLTISCAHTGAHVRTVRTFTTTTTTTTTTGGLGAVPLPQLQVLPHLHENNGAGCAGALSVQHTTCSSRFFRWCGPINRSRYVCELCRAVFEFGCRTGAGGGGVNLLRRPSSFSVVVCVLVLLW